MIIELKANGPVADKGVEFLVETHSMICGFVKVYNLITSDPKSYYSAEYEELGVSPEECVLDKLDDIISSMSIDTLPDIVCRGYFGSGLSSAKYLMAHTTLEDIYIRLRGNIDTLTPIASKELSKIASDISYALGNLLFAFSKILFYPIDAKEFLSSSETYTFSQDIRYFFSRINTTPEKYAAMIIELRSKFISVIPLFIDDPEAWEKLTAKLQPGIVDFLIDYGTYVTEFDLRAYKLGLLNIDESFIDELCNRTESSDYIGNVAPAKWLKFTKLLTDEQVGKVLPLVDSLTSDDLNIPIEEGKLSDAYFKILEEKSRGGIARDTNYFT